jgi:tetratricopeptide (TPR) repeat protein
MNNMNKLKKIISGITGRKKSKRKFNKNRADKTLPSIDINIITTRSTHINIKTTSSTYTNITTSSVSDVQIVQYFRLVWLDSSIDGVHNNDCINTITKLGQVVKTGKKFTDIDECVDFITDIEDEKIFMITSGELGQKAIPIIHDMAQIDRIYIFCKNKALHEQWTQVWPKVRGVFTDITPICEAFKKAAQDCDHNAVSISFIKTTDGALNQNLDILDQSFMYTQILKEILLTIDFDQSHINEFLMHCRKQFGGNTILLENIDNIEKQYRDYQPIWWYTRCYFLYSMLNTALRTMDIDLIIKMGFFLQDLHNHIAVLHSEQYNGHYHSNSFTVYRGQGLFQTDFNQLMKTQGGLISFNNFLSTSVNRAVSFAFAESNHYNPDLIGVLFEITINPSMSTSPFANIEKLSYYQGEEEILFSMHSVFRIGQVKQIDNNDRLWQVDLTLTSDSDPQLLALTERMREETYPHLKGWYRLGNLLVKLAQFDKAQQVFDIMLDQTTEQKEKANIYYMLGMIKRHQGEFAEAIRFYENAIKIDQETLPPNHPNLATSYINIGLVYSNMREYSTALSYYEKALKINEKTLPSYHPNLATSYGNIGEVYDKINQYSKALSYYEKALEIRQKILPANHPDLATSYNNLGLVYKNMDEYSKALSYYEKALEIRKKTLPANHPDLASSYGHIGIVYYKMREHSKAVLCHERALKIVECSLPPNHRDIRLYKDNLKYIIKNV